MGTEEARDREALCAKELKELLSRHGCTLEAAPQFVPDGIGGFRVKASIVLKATTDE